MGQKLHTIVALVQGRKKRWDEFINKTHHGWGKVEQNSPLIGITRVYQPVEEDGEKLPTERRELQAVVRKSVAELITEAKQFYNLIHCNESSNCEAVADVVVGGKVLVEKAPVGFLMFLEKQLTDLRTFIGKIPTLPLDQKWTWDANRGCYVSDTHESIRTVKAQEPLVLYHATPEHPAQTQMITRDKPAGTWRTTLMCGAIPVDARDRLFKQADAAREAVVKAREEANSIEVKQEQAVDALVDFVFDGFDK